MSPARGQHRWWYNNDDKDVHKSGCHNDDIDSGSYSKCTQTLVSLYVIDKSMS